MSLESNTTATFNTAVGAGALLANTGDENTATGAGALLSNTIGMNNTANGAFALFSNTEGTDNTANGVQAAFSNTTGISNTAIGKAALFSNDTGFGNTAIGAGALASNTTGFLNVALGGGAGGALTTGINNIDIGYDVVGVVGESNTIRIGNTDITATIIRGISGATAAGGDAVFVTSNGHLGTVTSSKRFKEEIKRMDKASEALFALKPVTFRYKKAIDPEGTSQFGLVAEDVEKVNSNLVVRDEEGKVNSVRYDQVNAMLLNEFLKEHKALVEEQDEVKKLEGTVAGLLATVKEQAVQIQSVRAHVEMAKPASQALATNP